MLYTNSENNQNQVSVLIYPMPSEEKILAVNFFIDVQIPCDAWIKNFIAKVLLYLEL